MEIILRSRGAITVLELNGRFDAHTVPQVKKELERASGPNIVVNLSGVHFIDSAGLSVLVSGMKRCRQDGGDLHLCGLQQPVQIIFELTKLYRAFETFSDEREAVAAFER